MDNKLILLNITDRKAIDSVEMFYLDNNGEVIRHSIKVSYNKYSRVRKIVDNDTDGLENILKKTENILVKVKLHKSIVILAVIPNVSFDDERIVIVPVRSRYVYKGFKKNGLENTFGYIESYSPDKNIGDFDIKYILGGFVEMSENDIIVSVTESNMDRNAMESSEPYYRFLSNSFDEGLLELYRYELKSNISVGIKDKLPIS